VLSPAHQTSTDRGRALAIGLFAAVLAVALGAAALTTFNAPNAGARTDRVTREAGVGVGHVAHVGKATSKSQAPGLGTTAGQAALGVHTTYSQPASLANPSQPAIIDRTGWDEPDPFVLAQNGRYDLFTSYSNSSQNVPVRWATAFGQWSQPTDALPDLPAWAASGTTWAPDAAQFGSNYVLYFTAQQQDVPNGTKCIGDAVSTSPAGPYISSPAPFVCQSTLGGAIDPRVFVDSNGQAYLVWKSDQNAVPNGGPTQIWSQALSADGMQLEGSPTAIFGPDEAWQQGVIEAPQMALVQGTYYLFYSGGHFFEPSYGIGVARCAGPVGPCDDTSSEPLVGSNLQGWGPGEESVFTNSTGVWMVYSPWFANLSGTGPPRPVALARLGFGAAGPYLAAPYQSTGSGAATTASSRAP
jgi:hypothetical protein